MTEIGLKSVDDLSSRKKTYRVAIAPMVRVSTPPARCLWRILAPDVYVYSAMVHARAVLRNSCVRESLVPWSVTNESVQIADNDPETLHRASRVLSDMGWQEINLNAGCPAKSAFSGGFGLHLMRDPPRLMECLAAMKAGAPHCRISVKCRIGVDGVSGTDFILPIVAQIRAQGVDMVILHARSGWSSGLSPKDNRTIPPLDSDCVREVCGAMPGYPIVFNGGISTISNLCTMLKDFSAIMIGRWIQNVPSALGRIQGIIDPQFQNLSMHHAVDRALDRVVEEYHKGGGSWRDWLRVIGPWCNGQPGASKWRQMIVNIVNEGNGARLLELHRQGHKEWLHCVRAA